MRLPFDNDVVEEMLGVKMCLSRGNLYSSVFQSVRDVVLEKHGKMDGVGSWETLDGALRILGKKGELLYEFRALETRNGQVYAMGRDVMSTSQDGFARVTLHKKVPVTPDAFGICVSSHVNYEETTLPVLFKSLVKGGMDMSRVVVVVGGDNKADGKVTVDPKLQVKCVRCMHNSLGFTALAESAHLSDSLPYWLLLHDTCDVTGDFMKGMAEADIGLSPDIVLFRPPEEKIEIGLYSSRFIRASVGNREKVKATEHLSVLASRANVVVVLNSPWRMEPAKDIYGTGNKRETIVFQSFGIRKFKGKDIDGGKP